MSLRNRKKPTQLYNVDELIPPEGVPLKLNVAGVGVRTAAQITDALLTLVGAIAIVTFIAVLEVADPTTLIAIGSMLFFVIRIPYYVVTELAWNGQTLGKRLMKIKVVSHDGKSLTAHALVVRNLMKEAEIFLPATLVLTLDKTTPVASVSALLWIIAGLMVPLMNHHRRRLGDFIAGTYVVHLPEPVLLQDLTQHTPMPQNDKEQFAFLSHHLDHYGAFELQTLEDILRNQGKLLSSNAARNQRATIAAIVEKIRLKIEYSDAVKQVDHVRFLRTFYNAQRAHLEQRQLFGERRADKHHTNTDNQA